MCSLVSRFALCAFLFVLDNTEDGTQLQHLTLPERISLVKGWVHCGVLPGCLCFGNKKKKTYATFKDFFSSYDCVI